MREGWSRGAAVAVVVAIAVACGFLNSPQSARAEPAVEVSFSIAPIAVEVRAMGVAVAIKV